MDTKLIKLPVFYEIYAWLLGLWPVLVMNGIFGLLVLLEIGLKIHYDRLAELDADHLRS